MANHSPVEQSALLHLYSQGDDVPGNIGESFGHPSHSVTRALQRLQEDGLVESKGRGVWTLTPKGIEAAKQEMDRLSPD